MKKGQLIVMTGPSGVGKGTLVRSLLKQHPDLNLSISVTTRSPRPGEVNGREYYFVDRHQFNEMIANGELLEWAEFAGNYYGTPLIPVKEKLETGKSVLLEIELEGARQIRETFPGALRIFIMPPSMAELERRLRGRGQDSEEAINRRLQRAKEEINASSEFDIEVINDDLDLALKRLEGVLYAPVC